VQIVDVYDKTSTEIIEEIEELKIEIKDFDTELLRKVKWLVLNKIDLLDDDRIKPLKEELENKFNKDLHIYCISAAKKLGTKQLMRDIGEFMESSND